MYFVFIQLKFYYVKQALTLSALESFSGRRLAEEIKENINHPSNAFNAETNAHDAYDKLVWGIEAIQVGNEVNKLLLLEGPEV